MKCEDIKQFTKNGNYCVQMTMQQLVERINKDVENMELILDSDFQRGHVWTEEQQIAFVEYFLKGGKSGRDLYFNNPLWSGNRLRHLEYKDYVCVDGLQRITAVMRFMNNEIPAFGMYYKDFEDDWMFTHDMFHVFNFHVNDLQTKEEVLQWYIDMNIGGTPHTREEITKVEKILENLREEKRMAEEDKEMDL